jgi:GntR family transcriptional regulator/MocR family aminotransferase
MARRAKAIDLPAIGELDRAAGHLGRQLAQALREAIRRGDLKPGELLPSTRLLAQSLQVARGTVIEAFEQLIAEGFLASLGGAGTRVASALGESPSHADKPPARARRCLRAGRSGVSPVAAGAVRHLRSGRPDGAR